ncbi:hypothetical protein N7475_009421 [Penicillium sp. IBT 31633x]|nr:hypothetical protein N7475_009421 [Penicillium sp. IBT 31633x]
MAAFVVSLGTTLTRTQTRIQTQAQCRVLKCPSPLGPAPPEWQSGIGTVIVARKDKKDLTPDHYEAIWMYCDYIPDYFGEGAGAPKHLYSRQAFERWFANYQRDEPQNGRKEWNSVPPLY